MVLQLVDLSKQFGPMFAVTALNLSVEQGTIYGILGPNGSGKTTTLGMTLGVIRPTSGQVIWFGQPHSGNERRRIGSILETPNFYPYLSAANNLRIAADIKGVDYSAIERVLEIVGLSSRKNSQFSTYSLGMKQRLSIASALLGKPEVIVLDEPTNGLDPAGIAEIRGLIKDIAKEGHTIILASHLLDEVEKVCTHVAVLQKGRLITAGSVAEVLAGESVIEAGAEDMAKLITVAKANPEIKLLTKNDMGKLELTFNTNVTAARLNDYFYKNGIILNHLALRKKSLEERFLELTKT